MPSGFYIPNLDDIHEPEPVEDGFYELEIIDVRDEKGERISVFLNVLNPPVDAPRPPFIYHTLWQPREGVEQWKAESTLLALKRFFALFGIAPPEQPLSEDEFTDWLRLEWCGKRAASKVRKVYNDKANPPRWQNELVVPPLASGEFVAAPKLSGLHSI